MVEPGGVQFYGGRKPSIAAIVDGRPLSGRAPPGAAGRGAAIVDGFP